MIKINTAYFTNNMYTYTLPQCNCIIKYNKYQLLNVLPLKLKYTRNNKYSYFYNIRKKKCCLLIQDKGVLKVTNPVRFTQLLGYIKCTFDFSWYVPVGQNYRSMQHALSEFGTTPNKIIQVLMITELLKNANRY